MKKFLKVFSCVAMFSCFIASGMQSRFAEIYIPSPCGERFTKKWVHELTSSDFERIHSQPAYESELLKVIERFQMTIHALQQQRSDIGSIDSSAVHNGTISAIHDYLIDEASPSKIPTVCSLIDDLIGNGVPNTSPDLLFFRGVILFNPEFLDKVPASYLEILTGGVEVTDYKDFGLELIRQAEQDGCSDATEYLRNI